MRGLSKIGRKFGMGKPTFKGLRTGTRSFSLDNRPHLAHESRVNLYDKICGIMLESRIESYIERLDEKARYQKEIEKGNLSDNAVRRLRRAELKGKLDEPRPEYFSGGRITRIQRLKKEAAQGKENKAKGKPYNIPAVNTKPRELPKGPGKQTGPLERRGIKIKRRRKQRKK